MKSQREPFEDELRERLQNYTDESVRDLWKEIAPNIVSVNSEPRWVVWPRRLSLVLVGLIVLLVTYRISIVGKVNSKSIPDAQLSQGIEHDNVRRNHFLPEQAERENVDDVKGEQVTSQKAVVVIDSSNEPLVINATALSSETSNFIAHAGQLKPDSLPDAVLTRLEQPTIIVNDTPKLAAQKLLLTTAVEASQKNEHHRKHILYFTAMPTFGYQRIESNQTDNLIIESIERIPAFSTKRLGIRAELGIEYPLTPKLNVFGGLLYYQRKQTIGYTEKYLDSTLMVAAPGGEILIEPQYSYPNKSIDYELRNVGIQIGFNYILSRKKTPEFGSTNAISSKPIPIRKKTFLHMIGTGIEFHKALNKTNKLDRANGFSNPSAYVFYNIYYRLQYPSEGKLRAIFQPTLNYSFYINENLHTPFYVKPYGLGLNFGCVYNF